MAIVFAALIAQAVLPIAVPTLPAGNPCARFDSPSTPPAETPRRITADDLATLADIGRSDPYESPSPFGLSPDGKRIAFLVRRADPITNDFCQTLLVMSLGGKAAPRELNRGGEFIRETFRLRNFPAVRAGWAKVIVPRWSPDGSAIGFLKRIAGHTQLWTVPTDGSGTAAPLAALADDIDDFAWTADGKGLIIATRPALRAETEAIARESRSGFLFDDRFAPGAANRPIPTGPLETVYSQVSVATREVRDASPAEAALLTSRPATGQSQTTLPPGARSFAVGKYGAAWTVAKDPARLLVDTKLVIRGSNGNSRECAERDCEGAQHLWWLGRDLYVLQRNGWGASQTALLRWHLGDARPRRVFVTDDALIGCQLAGTEILCARESATRPRRIVALDPRNGREREVYDPNPAFRALELGPVQRLHFRNAFGVECYADLVLPPGRDPGVRLPLVVVQYVSDGFLRGGTGDEVPVQVLAAKGFAVLSFARPDLPESVKSAPDETELGKRAYADWLDRRSVQSSLEIALKMAIATGTVDPERMGISGISEGTSMTQWALVNSTLFKAASLGICCEDIYAYPLAAGPIFEQTMRELGYRWFEAGAERFWRPLSLVLNADWINTPILVQSNDGEYATGLDVAEAFRRRGKPFEMHVFENETHIKWQPAHRIAIYQRTTEWFAFWLQHRMNCASEKAAQYARWKAMKGAPSADQLSCEVPPASGP